jgi:hypothetical protein
LEQSVVDDYLIAWVDRGVSKHETRDGAEAAFALANSLIDNGMQKVAISVEGTNSVIRGRAILDIYDAINGSV